MHLHWSALDLFAYAVPLRWETTRMSAVLSVITVLGLTALLIGSSVRFNELESAQHREELDQSASSTFMLPNEHANYSVGVTVRSSGHWQADPFSAAFFTLVMMKNVVYSAGADPDQLENESCQGVSSYCRCKYYAGTRVRCQREIPLDPCVVGASEAARCPRTTELLKVKSTFDDPEIPYEYLEVKMWPCGGHSWVSEACSPNVTDWWQTSKITTNVWMYERILPDLHANGAKARRALYWRSVAYVAVNPSAAVTAELYMRSTRFRQWSWLSIFIGETAWLNYNFMHTRNEPHGDELLKLIWRIDSAEENVVTEKVHGLWEVFTAFGATSAILWTLGQWTGTWLNRMHFHRLHKQRKALLVPTNGVTRHAAEREPNKRRSSIGQTMGQMSVREANQVSSEALAMMLGETAAEAALDGDRKSTAARSSVGGMPLAQRLPPRELMSA